MDDEQFTKIRNQCVVWSFNYYRGATYPRTSLELLEKLADDEYWGVRSYVAKNPNCSIKLLEKLADDEDRYVRSYVSENPNCPEYIKTFIEARNYMEKYYEQD